jgi:hypothetical protein
MDGPERGGEEARSRAAQEQQCQFVYQPYVHGVQNEIYNVISRGIRAVPQHRVIEEEGQSRHRAVEAISGLRPPIIFGQDGLDIVRGDRLHACVGGDDGLRVLRQTEAEGIGVCRQRDE